MKGIKCIASLFDGSGYAAWARSYIKCLIKSDIPVTIGTDLIRKTGRPITFETTRPDLGEDQRLFDSHVGKDIEYDTVISWLTPDMAIEQTQLEPPSVKKINMTLWETDLLPKPWPRFCSYFDEIWVPGEFNKEVFERTFQLHGVTTPVKTLDYPMDFDKYDSYYILNINDPVTGNKISDNTYIFYFISQWTERKNFKDLLEAYWAEFSEQDDVILLLKTYGRDYSEESHNQIQSIIGNLSTQFRHKKLAKCSVIRNLLSDEQMYALHKTCNCYVSPSRGEGLGLGILEAGIFGATVISHLFGEQASYINKNNSLIYNHTLRPVTGMNVGWYTSDQSWASPDVKDMMRCMRESYENRYQDLGKKLRQDLLSRCSYDNVVSQIKELLNYV